MMKGDPAPIERPIVSPRTAFWITDILSDPAARAYIFGRGGDLEFPFDVAVKTGTSQAYHDNWTVGYTRHVTVGVWVGNFDRTPLRDSSGVTGAGPIFHAVMLAAEGRAGHPATLDPIVERPTTVEAASICALSGMRANPWCPSKKTEWIGVEDDAVPCAWHHTSDEGLLTVYPPEYRAWARQSDPDAAAASARPIKVAAATHSRTVLTIASPASGTIYSIDPTLRPEFQAVSLRAVAPSPTSITWTIDGRHLGTTSSESSLAWPLTVGEHRIEARDAVGRSVETTIVVR